MTRVVQRPGTGRVPAAVAGLVAIALTMIVAALLVDAYDDQPATTSPATAVEATATSPSTTTSTVTSTTATETAPEPSIATTTNPAADPSPIDTAPPAAAGGDPTDRGWSWFDLADCESGEWMDDNDNGRIDTGEPIDGSADWTTHDSLHQGGLQFAASTWDGYAPAGYPADAHLASVDEQIAVAELVLDAQGPGAWPTCGPVVGMSR